jgi:hypothetical protein
MIKGTFEFRTIRNGTKVVTKDMDEYLALMRQLDASKIPDYTFHPKSVKLTKAIIRHLPGDTPAKDISDEILALGFNVTSVRLMTATQPEAEGGLQTHNIPLFLVTLARNEKGSEIFKLTNFGHVIIRFGTYKAQGGTIQCLNCQRFRHVWVNCKQPPPPPPPRCMWVVCGAA